MCGRYALVEPVPEIARLFGFDPDAVATGGEGRQRYNIAPQTPVLTVVAADGGGRAGRWMRWGLTPPWSRPGEAAKLLINARAETVATSPAFRAAFARRRCLLPATAFYEWGEPPDGSRRRQPFAFRDAAGRPLALAGIYQGSDAPTLAIVTTGASGPVARIHDRMPVLVAPADWDAWLDPDAGDGARDLCRPAPEDALVAYPVTARMNSARYEAPDALEPLPAVGA